MDNELHVTKDQEKDFYGYNSSNLAVSRSISNVT